MNRLKRSFSNRPFRAAWLCAMAVLALAAIWLLTLRTGISFQRPGIGGVQVGLGGGVLTVMTSDGFISKNYLTRTSAPRQRAWFEVNHYSISGRLNWTEIAVPIWMMMAGLGLTAPAFAWGGRRISLRRRGVCTKCGYSLEGLADESACPECGYFGDPVVSTGRVSR